MLHDAAFTTAAATRMRVNLRHPLSATARCGRHVWPPDVSHNAYHGLRGVLAGFGDTGRDRHMLADGVLTGPESRGRPFAHDLDTRGSLRVAGGEESGQVDPRVVESRQRGGRYRQQ